MENYKSPYEAYPFLSDKAEDLRCDFELLTDLIASEIGVLQAKVEDVQLKKELLKVCELVYHANATLRTKFTVTAQEIEWLKNRVEQMRKEYQTSRFVLTAGCETASMAHVLRVRGKMLVRLIYRHIQNGNTVDTNLLDFSNLLSGYFFGVALMLNKLSGVCETEFVSRNY